MTRASSLVPASDNHNICDLCAALASEALVGPSESPSNELVVFRRCHEVRACLFCRRRPPAGGGEALYVPIGRERWWKVPVVTVVQATRLTGESVAMCDACVESYAQSAGTPPHKVQRFFLFLS